VSYGIVDELYSLDFSLLVSSKTNLSGLLRFDSLKKSEKIGGERKIFTAPDLWGERWPASAFHTATAQPPNFSCNWLRVFPAG
jgi:hypothetical protein